MIQIPVTVFDGRIDCDRKALRDLLQGVKDGPYVLSLKQLKAQRTNQANRRYWALITVAAREIGYDDPEELHEGVAQKFLKLPDDEVTGLPRRKRTPKLSTKEFAEYSEVVERFFLIDLHLDLTDFYQQVVDRSQVMSERL